MNQKQEVTILARIEKKPGTELSTPPDAERLEQSKHPKCSGYTDCTQSSGSPPATAAPASTSLNAKTTRFTPAGQMILKSALPRTAAAEEPSIPEGADRCSPYTSSHLPDKIVAARRELQIKKLPRKRKLALLSEPINSLNDRS